MFSVPGWPALRIALLLGLVLLGTGVFSAPAASRAASQPPASQWQQLTQNLAQMDLLPPQYEFGLGAELFNHRAAWPSIRLISPEVDEEWHEESLVTIRYQTTGPISRVRLYYYGGNCPLGGRARGSFGRVIAGMVPNTTVLQWKIPWIDATAFRLRIAGYNDDNEMLAEYERTVRFRPKELSDLPPTCIAVIKRKQRLYYYEDGRIVRMHIVSTGIYRHSTPDMHPGAYSRSCGAMGEVFSKSRNAWSRAYDCWMPYYLAITASGSHGIHATTPSAYRYLGRPASHGCIRQHRADAKILYNLVPVGTPVYVF